MKRKRLINILAIGAVCATCLVGGTLAYLTDAERVTNKFQVGKIDIELTEPTWNETENQEITPTQIIKKDPQITNVGINDAFVYLEVSVPMASVITTNNIGIRENNGVARYQELFTFAPNSAWTLLKSEELNRNMVYTYSYNQILKKNAVTTPLFQTVTFANVVEGQIDEQKYDVKVNAFAIQTEHTGDDGSDIPAQAKAAYTKYANQNLGTSGAVEVGKK